MILTDVYVPAMNAVYDFQLDENTPVHMLIDEIVEILLRKSGGSAEGKDTDFVLCGQEKGIIFDGNKTLTDYQIKNGSRLMIV